MIMEDTDPASASACFGALGRDAGSQKRAMRAEYYGSVDQFDEIKVIEVHYFNLFWLIIYIIQSASFI